MRIIIAAIGMISAATLAFAISEPLLAIVLDAHGEDEDAIGISGAVQLLSTVAAAFFATRILRIITIQKLLFIASIIIVLLFLTLPLHIDAYLWMPARFAIGFLGSMVWIIGETLLNTHSPAAMRGRVMGIYGAVSAGSIAAAPLILQSVGTTGWNPFFAMVAAIMAAGMLALLLPKTVRKIALDDHERGAWRACYRTAPAIFWLCGLFSFSEFQIWVFLTLYGQSIGHSETEALNMLFFMAVGGSFWPFIAGWLADRFSLWVVMHTHIFIYLITMIAMPLLAQDLWVGYGLSFLVGVCLGGIYTLALAALGQTFVRNQLVAATALFTMTWGLGAALGTISGGYLIVWFGYAGIFWIGAAALGIFMIIYLPKIGTEPNTNT